MTTRCHALLIWQSNFLATSSNSRSSVLIFNTKMYHLWLHQNWTHSNTLTALGDKETVINIDNNNSLNYKHWKRSKHSNFSEYNWIFKLSHILNFGTKWINAVFFLVFSKLDAYTTELPHQLTYFRNPRMRLFYIPQCSIQNRNVHISVLNRALWDMEQLHSGIHELGQ